VRPARVAGEGWAGPCGSPVRTVFYSAPREHLRRLVGDGRREWNFEEIEVFHWGTSRAGRDERQVNSGLVALDGWFRFEYD
jgi:hypothetical protein